MLREQEADRVYALMHMCAYTQQQEIILENANEGVFFLKVCELYGGSVRGRVN